MGFLDGARANAYANKGYKEHAAANRLSDDGKKEEARKKYAAALGLYREAEKLAPMNVNYLMGYIILLMREGFFEEAKEKMLAAEKRKDLKKDGWYSLRLYFSYYQWHCGELDKAIETIRRAGKEKMTGLIYSTLGMYLIDKARQTGDFTEAMSFNLEAMDYDDEDGATLDNMGQLYDAMSRAEPDKAEEYHKKAIDYFKKAREAKPRQITTIYWLAKLFHEDGDDVRARKVLTPVPTLYYSRLCPVSEEMMDALVKEVG